MSKEKDDNIMGHEYDGIQELDNELPNWWLIILMLTVVWGFLYWLHYSIAGGPSQLEEYETQMAQIEQQKQKQQAAQPGDGSPKSLQDLIGDKKSITSGKAMFLANCASCHAKDGGGSIGPNLTDNYWIHGDGTPETIVKVIKEGIIDKGMPPWGPVLSEAKINNITVFIVSLKGTKPGSAKAPQGKEYK